MDWNIIDNENHIEIQRTHIIIIRYDYGSKYCWESEQFYVDRRCIPNIKWDSWIITLIDDTHYYYDI